MMSMFIGTVSPDQLMQPSAETGACIEEFSSRISVGFLEDTQQACEKGHVAVSTTAVQEGSRLPR
jgi:hypothetical protein